MNRQTISNIIGFLLLVVCFGYALVTVFSRSREDRFDGREVIRFAHWQLEGGLRTALDVLSRDYEKLHPDVRVEQLAIPERTYTQWLQTQLIGGTATDLIALGKMPGSEDEMLARYFLPVSDYVEKPNPYNKGTDLENTAWRNTFTDGLVGGVNYRPNLLEYYSVPMSMHTIRLYYNVRLWKRILGDTPAPTTYDGFQAICQRVEDYARREKIPVIPIAGSRINGPLVIYKFANSQTQKVVATSLRNYAMSVNPVETGVSFLRGDWSLDTPAVSDGLAITREVGLRLQAGYPQISREDATFYFIQERALLIATGSYDAPSFREQASFGLGVFRIPIPTPDHPRYGRNVYGDASEATIKTSLSFGIPLQTRNRERAIDFIQFLTSREHNERFTELSSWLPSVTGARLTPEVEPFLPAIDGYVDGFQISEIGANTGRIVANALNILVNPAGSLEGFKASVAPGYKAAVRADLARQSHVVRLNIMRQDLAVAAGACRAYAATRDDSGHWHDRLSVLLEAQNQQEATRAWIDSELARTQTANIPK
ncbi:MAG: extracellular solute-binding protein [Opitutaceae bacterium]|jgi:raffinose/stachyose/melibiose transport system substrate-binding protein|nr:extracellular solute-binding protein [Opitutaceae bacterium]